MVTFFCNSLPGLEFSKTRFFRSSDIPFSRQQFFNKSPSDRYMSGGRIGSVISNEGSKLDRLVAVKDSIKESALNAVTLGARFGEYSTYLRSTVRRQFRISDKAVLDDIISGTFAKAVEFLNTQEFNGAAKIETWLYRIAVNIHLMSMRANHQHDNAYEGKLGEHLRGKSREDEDPETLAIENERLSRLRKIIDSLRPKEKELFLLRYKEGLSNEEIVERLGISLSAAKTRLHRVVKAVLSEFRAMEKKRHTRTF